MPDRRPREGVYDPATVNGRLVLGLEGTLSEMELHAISSRMRAGILNKAERGELALRLPTGLVRDEHGLGSTRTPTWKSRIASPSSSRAS
jgi:DNA invertase Pin-like site-specific DNA recombinase